MKIKVSEHFYSIQGEGISCGVPAVFLRLSGCALDCVWCDTAEVWKKGEFYEDWELSAIFKAAGYFDALAKGAHLVITGGDPLIQQRALVEWFEFLIKKEKLSPRNWFIEVETEGVLQPMMQFADYVRQWNVSPKLANSGMSLEKRRKLPVLNWHNQWNSIFKFPVRYDTDDLAEVFDLIRFVDIPRERVWLMPVCATREDFIKESGAVIDWCKQYGFNFSSRLHLVVWNKACGV